MTTTTDYRASSRALMAQSRDELARGDLQQASENGWGAAAQMLKAVSDQRGWNHGRHRHLTQVASRPREETGDRDIYRYFAVANELHGNFYENEMSAQDIAEALEDVEGLLEKLGTSCRSDVPSGSATPSAGRSGGQVSDPPFCCPTAVG